MDEYMSWTEKLGDKGMSEAPTSLSSEGVEGTMHLHVIDVFHEFLNEFYFLVSDPLLPDAYSFKSSSALLIRGFQQPSCIMASSPALLSPHP